MKNKSPWIIILVFVFLFACLNYIYNNKAEIFAEIGKHYSKTDISKSLNYYEKAFNYGYNDTKAREIYINLLLNSPLNLENQRKILDFLEIEKEDFAKIKAEQFVEGLLTEINRVYPENYIAQTVYNKKVLRWGKNPITYKFSNKDNAPDYFAEEIKLAFNEIEKATGHKILFMETGEAPNIKIEFDAHNPADPEEKKYVIAYTYPTISINTLEKMSINFYIKNPQDEYFSKNQIYNTALHEIIHALGFLGHSSDKNNIMYLTKDSISVAIDERASLTTGDISTIKLLYDIQPDITNEIEFQGKYIPQFILGNEEEMTYVKMDEAKTYINKAPELPSGYIDLAETYVAQEYYAKAIKQLEKALRLSDTNEIKSMVYYNLAVVYYKIANYEMSEYYLKMSIDIDNSDEKHYLLAENYKAMENYEKAEIEYKNLISKNPKNIEYTIGLTNLYIINKNYLKARKTLKSYIKNSPKDKNNPRFKPYGILTLFL